MSKRLMIGIDARAATEVPAGRGRVVRELLRALAERDDDVDYLLFARARWEDPLDDRFRWALIGSRDPAWHARVGRVATRRCDVFLATNSYLSVLLADMPCVLLVYDLAALDPATSPNRRSAVIERLTLTPAVRRATRLVCISQATADALHDLRPEVADQVLVAPLAASASPTAAPADELAALPAPGFVLAVGTLEPRKNLPRLVAAYSALSESLQTAHPLVVVGATGWRTGETLEALRSLGARCQMLGHVSDVTLAELYRRCAVFCYPSLAEGFGLPVLEAMSAGAPVLTSSVSSLPEVGGEAAAYADPYDVTAIAQALRAILEDPTLRHALAAAGPPRAAQFSWDRFAGQVLGAIRDAAQSAPSTRR